MSHYLAINLEGQFSYEEIEAHRGSLYQMKDVLLPTNPVLDRAETISINICC